MASERVGSVRSSVRLIALAMACAALGFILRAALRTLLDIEISRLVASVLNFALAAFAAFCLFPKWLKQPFGKVGLSVYLKCLGFHLPPGAWKHVVLGVVLALCTLGGMLIGALLSGRYVLDWSTVSVSHTVFSLNPGVWEEFFYRGIVMAVLLKGAKSVRRAALIQILLFGLAHVKGFGLWSWMDVISVMIVAVGLTYAAYKTRTLISGVVFHFAHDALLYLVQVPRSEELGFVEHAVFHLALWTMAGVACLLTRVAAERLGVQARTELYQVEPDPGRDVTRRHQSD
jgi:hypothetical protein